jgi:hypothetical protein
MAELPDLIREYCELLEQEGRLKERKEDLRNQILTEMGRHQLADVRYAQGSALRTRRFKLLPRQEAVLEVLDADDLFPFAQFTPARVKELLVPKYGRERLLPLFDVQKSDVLVVKRPGHAGRQGLQPR